MVKRQDALYITEDMGAYQNNYYKYEKHYLTKNGKNILLWHTTY